ncbi:MAG: 16S rRNA (cytosine(1402)-N(4))-methyltransferase RsmH [Candidatus Magasanikbacteria bacterium]|nr:16S rRNA (cytosine(1402)-N(4))-methyltransferase RsmH [Candidatus Magasanikbacteria bacterium]
MRHVPVLLKEVVDTLQLKQGMNVIDATLGDAGHAEKILEKIGTDGKLLGIDADAEAVLRAKQYLYGFSKQTIFIRDNFVNLKKIVTENNFNPVNGILLDLGWSSPQFEERGRGFSFLKEDEPIDMRYGCQILNPKSEILNQRTASELVNNLSIDELEKIFREYGEEKLSKEIAEAIVENRKENKIEKVGDLVEIILTVYRNKLKSKKEIPWVGGLHPATKVFQALRIAVNDELDVLRAVLPQAVDALAPGGRLAVITFHSLEDRIVKHYFKGQDGRTLHIVSKKPIICSVEECENNPRARSAKLRVAERL